MKKIYLIGSLRNPAIPELAAKLRKLGFDVFDDWYAAGPEADDYWQKYEIARGHSYAEAMDGYAANHVYNFDKFHLDASDIAILALPAGKSGHLELGYTIGRGKRAYILLDEAAPADAPPRWDVMYLFADKVCHTFEALTAELTKETE
jgi:nucleoside 2-deoxyribosyltransferase